MREIGRVILIFPIMLLLWSGCKKEPLPEPEPHVPVSTEFALGLPEQPRYIHGYFYMCQKIQRLGFNYYPQMVMAAGFGDPSRNLLMNYDHQLDQPVFTSDMSLRPNVSVGRVFCNGVVMGNSSNTIYNMVIEMDTVLFDETATWEIDGNKSFVPFKVVLPLKVPKVIASAQNFSLQISSGYTLDVSQIITNYDSAAVMLRVNNAFPPIYKSIRSPDALIELSPNELVYLKNRTSCNVIVMGFNYCHKTIEDKVYVFESAAKLERIMTIKQ
jgi:hypothetical protein